MKLDKTDFFSCFKLFPSSKIVFWPFLKLQKMEFGQKNFSWNWFIWFQEFFWPERFWTFWPTMIHINKPTLTYFQIKNNTQLRNIFQSSSTKWRMRDRNVRFKRSELFFANWKCFYWYSPWWQWWNIKYDPGWLRSKQCWDDDGDILISWWRKWRHGGGN